MRFKCANNHEFEVDEAQESVSCPECGWIMHWYEGQPVKVKKEKGE